MTYAIAMVLSKLAPVLAVMLRMLLPPRFKRRTRRALGMHVWRYHNPYDRRCDVCQRHEVSHCASMANWDSSWWEAFNDGQPGHRCSRARKEEEHKTCA